MTRPFRLLWFGVMLSFAAWAAAVDRGIEPWDLETALSLFPTVDSWEVDRDGHLVSLEGQLTTVGSGLPARVASAFIDVHRHLFGAAAGSDLEVESIWQAGDRSVVTMRQSVDGFAATAERLEMTFAGSVLALVEGIVLDDRDVPAAAGGTMPRHKAIAVALSLLGPTMQGESTTVERILFGPAHLRCWRLETVARSGAGPVLQTVVIDAVDGNVLDLQVWALPAPGEGDGRGGDQPSSAVDGCAPVVPPVGEFRTKEGHHLWSGADEGCGQWQYDDRRTASLFHGDCLEFACDPFPSTDQCDHGEVRRGGLDLGAGLDRVMFRFLPPDREVFLRLRWGPGDNQAAPFLVRPAPVGEVTVELDLSPYESWDSAKIDSLTLELVDDHLVWIRSLDLWPGPWLEFASGPELVTDPPGGELIEGEQVTVVQDIRNIGCSLELGTHDDMRAVEYSLRRIPGSGGESSEVVCADARIPGRIAPETDVQNLPVCAFQLPVAGTWELEGRFVRHDSPPAATLVVVEPATAPNLAIDLSAPIDLYSGNLGGWPCRSDLLDLSRYDDPNPPCALPWVVALEVSAEGLAGPIDARIEAWGRPADPAASPAGCDPASPGWFPMAPAVTWETGNGRTVVEILLERTLLEAIPLGGGDWSLLDLRLAVEPENGEIDLEDNLACLQSWIPVAAGGLEDSMGPTWVDDDYFLDPEHWPPHGLAWTGVTVVHEEGGVSYDADSALAMVAVADGGNEDPRLVWFEDRPGETVSGALIRYRRSEAGFGGDPFLDAGAEEADGIPGFELDVAGHGNRSWLVTDSQWRTVVWRRGTIGPFGGYPVPLLETPGLIGDTVSLHLAPDTNCLVDEVGCASGLYPRTALDVVGVWREQGTPPPTPVFVVLGLRLLQGGQWLSPPAQVPPGQELEFAVEVGNAGPVSGTAVLAATVDVFAMSENPSVHQMTGSATVTIAPGDSHNLPIGPAWVPWTPGLYRLTGPVTESGELIGSVSRVIEVVEDPTPCPVPAVNLP